MSKKVVKKKKSKLIKTRLFTVLFAVMFIVSLFTGIKAFAETGPFKLNSATISDKASGVTGSISSFNDSEVINDVTFHKLDDYATFKFELKSNLNREITILEITDDNSNSYIAYEYDKHENEKLASNGTLNFIVKAVYKTELTDTSKRNQTNNVKFTIKYLDNGEEKSDEIIVNPKTGDGISKSIVMLIISSVGLVTCITLDKKRKSKKLSKLSVLILTGLVLSPIVVKAATYAYELTLKSTIGLYDKVVVTIDDKVNPVTTQTIEYNTKLDSLPSPTKEGYTLTKWTVGTSDFDIDENITSDITIEANYRKNNYTIRFAPNVPVGGTLDPTTSMADMDMEYGEEKNLLPNGYLVTGYLFDSWNTMPDGSGTKYEDMDSVKNLTSTDGETVTLYARWGATPYTVIFDKNSSQATGTMENISKAYNETFNLPENTYERTGYSFVGWNKSPAGDGTHYDDKQSVKNLDIDGEVTLYAEWSPALITISFDINTDDPEATGTMAGQIVVYDVRNNINENKFTRTGYAFDSWNTMPDGSGTKYNDKADITNVFLDNTTLYAQWAVTPYTVIFNKNHADATGSMNNQEIAYGQQVALTKNTYERTGYKFLGWNTQEDGQGTHFDDEELVKNLDIDGEVNLYAEWKELTSTLQTGSNVNTILKDINADATEFKQYSGIPNFDNIDGEVDIALSTSNFPVYIWDDNGTIYWWSEADIVYMNKESGSMFAETNFESIDLRNFDASNVVNMGGLFQNCTNLSEINLDGWNTSNVTNMGAMFAGCSKFEELNVSNLNTSKVSNFNYIFDNMFNLKTLNITNFDFTSAGNNQINLFGYNTKPTTIIMDNVTFNKNMTNILVNQNKLTTLSLDDVNTSNVELMTGLFSGCSSITSIDLSDFNTSNVTNMSSMFSGCTNLDTINGLNTFDTSSVTTMDSMFYNMKKMENLDISSFDSSELTNINNMFKASNFKTIIFGNDFTVSKITAMSQTFFNASQLVNLDLSKWNPTNLTKMNYMFYGANKLEVVDMTGWNLSNITTFTENFYISTKIKTIYTSDSIPASATSSTGNDFNSDTLLVGGAGTTMSNKTKEYARIDDPDNGQPGYFSIKGSRYIRYNGNGADGVETMTSHYLDNTGSLKTNTFTNTGKTFVGWNTEADGSGTSYTDGQLMSDLTESKIPLTLYAQWN